MRFLRYILLALIASATLCRAGFWSDFLKRDVSVITDTEMTPDGKKLAPTTPENPTYYLAVSFGYRDFGPAMAGENVPPSAVMLKHITQVLAKQGYRPATTKHKPTIALLYTWGTLYPDKIEDLENPGFYRQINRNTMLKFLGGEKMGVQLADPMIPSLLPPGMQLFSPDAQNLADVATDGLYMAALAAYDYEALFINKKKVLLWKTKISCPSRGLSMADTLPTMLTIAGPNIGKETPKPVWVDADEKFKGDVKVGNPVFEKFMDSGKQPVFEKDKEKEPSTILPPQKTDQK